MNEEPDAAQPRQRIVRSRHGRRARLTPAPGTTAEPVPGDGPIEKTGPEPADGAAESGPNDEHMRREKPPHY